MQVRWKMKKILTVFLSFVLLAAFCGVAMAEVRRVQLNVPNCSAWGSKHRISSILENIDGISKIRLKGKDTIIITFDDKKTTLKVIIKKLKEGRFDVKGKPVFLKDEKTPKWSNPWSWSNQKMIAPALKTPKWNNSFMSSTGGGNSWACRTERRRWKDRARKPVCCPRVFALEGCSLSLSKGAAEVEKSD